MKVWRRKWFKDVYKATEIVDDNAGVGQMTSPNGLGMKINEAAAAAEDRDCWREILCTANHSDGGRH